MYIAIKKSEMFVGDDEHITVNKTRKYNACPAYFMVGDKIETDAKLTPAQVAARYWKIEKEEKGVITNATGNL